MITLPDKLILYILPMLVQIDVIWPCGFREEKFGIPLLEIKFLIMAVYISSNENLNNSYWTATLEIYIGSNADRNGTHLVLSYVQEIISMVVCDWLYYTSITIDLLKVFDCSVMYPCFLSKCKLDLQNAWILYFTVHLIHLCGDSFLSISKCVHAYFCTFLHYYCTLLWYIISDKNSGAHKSRMVS